MRRFDSSGLRHTADPLGVLLVSGRGDRFRDLVNVRWDLVRSLSGACRRQFGGLWGAVLGPFWAFWGLLGASWGPVGGPLGPLGGFPDFPGPSWGLPRVCWRPRRSQEVPKRPPRGLQRPPGGPKRPPRDPKTPQEAPASRKGRGPDADPTGDFTMCFWHTMWGSPLSSEKWVPETVGSKMDGVYN